MYLAITCLYFLQGYIRVNICDHRKTLSIIVNKGDTLKMLSKQVEKNGFNMHSMISSFFFGGQCLRERSKTLEDVGIYDNAKIYIVHMPCGGGGVPLYSYCKDCLMRNRCPFNVLEAKMKLHEISYQEEDAYLILCRHFNISDEDIKVIEDNHEENYVRLGDVLHRIYHSKSLVLTQEEVIKIIDSSKAQ